MKKQRSTAEGKVNEELGSMLTSPRMYPTSAFGHSSPYRGGEHCIPAPLPFPEGEGKSEARGGVNE